MVRTSEFESTSLRVDNADGVRIVPAHDYKCWIAGAVLMILGHTATPIGYALYAVGGLLIVVAAALSFIFKNVQILQSGQWVTLVSTTPPSHAREVASVAANIGSQ